MTTRRRIPDVHPNTPCCANCACAKMKAHTRGRKWYCAEDLLFRPNRAPQNGVYATPMLVQGGERLSNALSRKRKCESFVSMTG